MDGFGERRHEDNWSKGERRSGPSFALWRPRIGKSRKKKLHMGPPANFCKQDPICQFISSFHKDVSDSACTMRAPCYIAS